MPILHLLILALIQGVTEFLPISSSGHLALYPLLTGAPDQGLKLDVATHIGTLAAVLVYFRMEAGMAIRGGIRLLGLDFRSREAKLALHLIVATIPAVIVGALLSAFHITESFRSLAVIGWATIIGALFLWAADRWGGLSRGWEEWGMRHAILTGLAQVVALIPGMSRSGMTIAAARALGYGRVDAARVSLLMSIPVTFAAGVLITAEVVSSGDSSLQADVVVAAILSFLAAYGAIWIFMRMLRTQTMTVFVIYRLILGPILLWLAYS